MIKKAKMNFIFIGWLHLQVPEQLCRQQTISCRPVCDSASHLQMVKQSMEDSFDFCELMQQVQGIGRMRFHLSPLKPKPF